MKNRHYLPLGESTHGHPIWERAIFLAKRFQGFHRIELWQLEETYIEVTYHSHFNVILKVSCFTDTAFLEPYLSSIDISALVA